MQAFQKQKKLFKTDPLRHYETNLPSLQCLGLQDWCSSLAHHGGSGVYLGLCFWGRNRLKFRIGCIHFVEHFGGKLEGLGVKLPPAPPVDRTLRTTKNVPLHTYPGHCQQQRSTTKKKEALATLLAVHKYLLGRHTS